MLGAGREAGTRRYSQLARTSCPSSRVVCQLTAAERCQIVISTHFFIHDNFSDANLLGDSQLDAIEKRFFVYILEKKMRTILCK